MTSERTQPTYNQPERHSEEKQFNLHNHINQHEQSPQQAAHRHTQPTPDKKVKGTVDNGGICCRWTLLALFSQNYIFL